MLTQERAIQIFADCKRTAGCGPWSDQFDKHMTADERREVKAHWDTMGGWASFADAFLAFVQGRVNPQDKTRDLFADIAAAGIPYDHHASDLYVPDTPQAREVIAAHGRKGKPFTSNIDGKPWLDIPFAYSPWWQDKQRKGKS